MRNHYWTQFFSTYFLLFGRLPFLFYFTPPSFLKIIRSLYLLISFIYFAHPSPLLPSGNHQFPVLMNLFLLLWLLFIHLFCFLDSTYKWNCTLCCSILLNLLKLVLWPHLRLRASIQLEAGWETLTSYWFQEKILLRSGKRLITVFLAVEVWSGVCTLLRWEGGRRKEEVVLVQNHRLSPLLTVFKGVLE